MNIDIGAGYFADRARMVKFAGPIGELVPPNEKEADIAGASMFVNLQVFRATLFYRQDVCLHVLHHVVKL